MALPKIALRGRKIILLSGFKDRVEGSAVESRALGNDGRRGLIVDEDKLWLAAKRNPDAVAFGYIAGRWVAAA